VKDRTEDGRQHQLLVVMDEYTQGCVAIEVGRSCTAQQVSLCCSTYSPYVAPPNTFAMTILGNDTGPEFVSRVICRWLKEADVKTLFIAKGSPWQNG